MKHAFSSIRPRTALWSAIVVTLAAAAFALAACDDNEGAGEPGEPVTEIVIEMGDDYFDPDHFTVQVGTTVTITAANEGLAIHNLIIDSNDGEGRNFSTELMVAPGEEDVFEATFTQPGTYQFQCSYHVPDQVGTLYVVE